MCQQRPEPEWISVGDLGRGFETHGRVLPPVDDLVGRTFDLDGERVSFADDGTAAFGDTDGPVHVTSLRPDVYFARMLNGDRGAEILVLGGGGWTRVSVSLPGETEVQDSGLARIRRGLEPTTVAADVRHGALTSAGRAHGPTDELVGLRNRYGYSPTETYEHIYLTPDRYTWFCRSGVEAGLADSDACSHTRIDAELVLFVWREKLVPTLGAVLIDMRQHLTDGVIVGHEDLSLARATLFAVGSEFTVLNRTFAPGERS